MNKSIKIPMPPKMLIFCKFDVYSFLYRLCIDIENNIVSSMFYIITCDTCLSTQCHEHKYIQIHINNVILIHTFI